jgi:conserved oligomeric Golgi complex subunit 5
LVTFQENAMSPFVERAIECVIAILATMYSEDFVKPASQTCSLYMLELQQVLTRFCRDCLAVYECKSIVNAYSNVLASRCIELFIRHASLLRPVDEAAGEATRDRLTNDSIYLESTVQHLLCNKLTDLGAIYKNSKAFRNLLQLKPPVSDDMTYYDGVLNESLPYSILLHYLFSFAPIEMKSPHQSLNWTPIKYSEWIDKHPNERDRCMVVKTTLEAYVAQVKAKNEKQFSNIYPLMFHLLQIALEKLK